MRRILVVAAAAVLGALVAFDAGAMPFPAKHGFTSSDATLVQVCPRGYRWSERRERCVPEERVREVCPPGFRFSESRQTCVPGF
jgi:hypothetical protein